MRPDKFTQKMQEALQAAQDVASQFHQQEITNEHFLIALLDQTDGVTRPLLEKMGVTVPQLRDQLNAELDRRPKIQGGNFEVRIGNELRSTIDAAEKEMAKLKDEFLSAEHYLLALADSKGAAAKLLKEAGITRDKLMSDHLRAAQQKLSHYIVSAGMAPVKGGRPRERATSSWRGRGRSIRSSGGTMRSGA